MRIAFVFPGQGSQSVGMLSGFAGNETVAGVMARADEALGFSLTGLIAEGPAETLSLTVNTQPAMLAAGGRTPEMMAGHSLGEYSALCAAGAMSLETAVRLVRFRAEAMQSAVPVGVGGMAAVIGLADDAVEAAVAEARETGRVEAVNFNAPGQVVIAGEKAAVARAIECAKARGCRRAIELPVSAPFHSSLMQPAADKLAARLAETEIQVPAIPVIANIDVEVHETPDAIREALARQAAGAVQWVRTIERMKAAGITDIVECGPGKVLTGLLRRTAPEINGHNIFDAASLAAVLEKLN